MQPRDPITGRFVPDPVRQTPLQRDNTSMGVLKDVVTQVRAGAQETAGVKKEVLETNSILSRIVEITEGISSRLLEAFSATRLPPRPAIGTLGLPENSSSTNPSKSVTSPASPVTEASQSNDFDPLVGKIETTNAIALGSLKCLRTISEDCRKSEVWLSVLTDQVQELLDRGKVDSLQGQEDRKEMADLLKKLGKGRDDRHAQPEKPKGSGLGALGLLGALLSGLAASLFESVMKLVKDLKNAFKSIFSLPKLLKSLSESKFAQAIGEYAMGFLRTTRDFFKKAFSSIWDSEVMKGFRVRISKVFNLEEVFGEGGKLMEFLKKAQSLLKLESFNKARALLRLGSLKTGLWLEKMVGAVSKVWGTVKSGAEVVGSWFTKIGDALGSVAEFFAVHFPRVAKFGKLLGKLAIPLTVLMAAYDTLKASIDQFMKSGDWGSTIAAGVKGLLNSVVSSVLDLGKNVVSWIAGKFGFDGVKEKLDSFKFSDIVDGLIDRIVGWGKYALEIVFQPISDAFQNITQAVRNGSWLKTIATTLKSVVMAPIEILRNVLGALSGVFSKELKAKIDAIDFEKLLHLKDISSGAPEVPQFEPFKIDRKGDDPKLAKAKDAPQATTPQTLNLPKRVDAPDQRLSNAYRETTAKKNTGAVIDALKSDTQKATAEKASRPIVISSSPKSAMTNVSSSVSSITFNANNIPDRTGSLLTPAFGY